MDDNSLRKLHLAFAKQKGINDLDAKVKEELEYLLRMDLEEPTKFRAFAKQYGGSNILEKYAKDSEGCTQRTIKNHVNGQRTDRSHSESKTTMIMRRKTG